jgi:steroid delta-isomerase-like uncharacterized protein
MKNVNTLLVLCLILVGFVCSGCKPSSNAKLEENKALVRRGLELMEKRDWKNFTKLHTLDYISHSTFSPKPQTLEETIQSFCDVIATFPDCSATIEDIIAEGDKVVIRELWRGTNKGDIEELGITATRKEVTLPIISIFRIVDGRIAETWELFDMMSFMNQLGVMPSGG